MLEQITVLGLILAMACLWWFNWRMLRQWQEERAERESFKKWVAKKAGENVEQRCQHCKAGKNCSGYNTGVVYPCKYYEEHSCEKRCKNYVGVACVDGSCPKANADKYEKYCIPIIKNCNECPYYEGCKDCALYQTEYCEGSHENGTQE